MEEEGKKENWSGKRDLNPRPSPWQGDALPLSYSRSNVGAILPEPPRRDNTRTPGGFAAAGYGLKLNSAGLA
jgi:hypothetical protein